MDRLKRSIPYSPLYIRVSLDFFVFVFVFVFASVPFSSNVFQRLSVLADVH